MYPVSETDADSGTVDQPQLTRHTTTPTARVPTPPVFGVLESPGNFSEQKSGNTGQLVADFQTQHISRPLNFEVEKLP